ncbi:acetate kinase [Rhodocytophaga aerolata]|uniref:Acetate kinase n=1 Tax=Rhodocytophaga aerolata TaxID=455078 RepID=A0ABT8R3D3_9BACT|nr:acetate kinase [Rhodocytophaga aerolata]MDO1446609.1 acetate kinase [Rhodocytophaga aerolata]
MYIFVINSGSSSIKYQLFEMPEARVLCSGLVERIGHENAVLTHKIYKGGKEDILTSTEPINDHGKGLSKVEKLLTDAQVGVLKSLDEIDVVGHRVVHGGERFAATTRITDDVKKDIQQLFPLAPLHNPSNFLGIEVAEQIFSKASQVAVFDTAFHQTMPPKAFRYAIPEEFYSNLGIRAYGFHGTSHKYVAGKAAEYLQKPEAKIITIHLGNGCSMSAVENGQCVDTSMGLGPMNGLIMGTRSGDIDQSVIFYLVNREGYSLDEVNTILNKKSGMLGLTGYNDMRDITKAIDEGNANAQMAYDMYTYRIKKYLGAYIAALNGLDAVVFTAGVGENDIKVRQMVCQNMEYLGITLDEEKNAVRSKNLREINKEGASVKVLVVPTNEELEIARQCYELLAAE